MKPFQKTFSKDLTEFVGHFYDKPTEYQSFLLENVTESKYMNVVLPRQSGLTSFFVLDSLYTALKTPLKSIVYMTHTQSSKKEAMQKLLGYLHLHENTLWRMVDYTNSDTIVFLNQSVIRFTTETRTRCDLCGVNMHCVILDNAGWYTTPIEDIITTVAPIISSQDGQILLGTTAESPVRPKVVAEAEEGLLKMQGYDDCIYGICRRFGQPDIIAYDYNKVIKKSMKDGMTREEAIEYFEYNQIGAWMGEKYSMFYRKG